MKNISGGIDVEQQIKELYTETLAIRRIQVVDLEKIRDAFDMTMLIKNTKIDSLIDNVSGLNVSITDAQISDSFDKLNITLATLYRDKGYDYFFEENTITTNEYGNKRMRLRSE